MERLTYKVNEIGVGDKEYNPVGGQTEITYWNCINKLGQLEDIEEKIGVDLVTLFKALTNDVYLYHNKKLIKCEQAPCLLCFDNKYCLEFQFEDGVEQVYLKDCGKTWALTREELE